MELIGIVLAAGDSSRMGSPKALLRYQGGSFAQVILDRMAEAGISRRILVLGRNHDAVIQDGCLGGVTGLMTVVNPDPDRGQLSSLQAAVLQLVEEGNELPSALVALVDHPTVETQTYRTLLHAWQSRGGAAVYLSRCRGKRGHPIVVGADALARVLDLPATAQMREAVHRPGVERIDVEVSDIGVNRDVDTPGDYEALLRPGRS